MVVGCTLWRIKSLYINGFTTGRCSNENANCKIRPGYSYSLEPFRYYLHDIPIIDEANGWILASNQHFKCHYDSACIASSHSTDNKHIFLTIS